MTIKPKGTPITIHGDINAEPPSYGNNLDKYHNVQWWDGDQFPATEGNFGAGLLQMSTFYNKRFTSPTPVPATQNLALANQYPFGGCAGAGWSGAVVHIVSQSSVTFTCVTRCNDYSCSDVNDNVTLGAFSNFYNSAGIPQTWEKVFSPGGWGRDAIAWWFRFVWDTKSSWLLHVMADCKGGGRGWSTIAVIPIANVRPVTAYPAAGTLLSSRCIGYYLYGLNADGSGGAYEVQLQGLTDGVCGYVEPAAGGGTDSTVFLNSCFLKGSPVAMADGTFKPIEDVQVGDYLLGAHGAVNPVLALNRPLLGDRMMSNINGEHMTTLDHAHLRPDNTFGAVSLYEYVHGENNTVQSVITAEGDVEQWLLPGFAEADMDLITQIEPGDYLVTVNGTRPVTTLEEVKLPADTQLYNFVMGGDHTYFVSDYCVTGFLNGIDFDYRNWKPVGESWTRDQYRRG
jgi:hypothetical protein